MRIPRVLRGFVVVLVMVSGMLLVAPGTTLAVPNGVPCSGSVTTPVLTDGPAIMAEGVVYCSDQTRVIHVDVWIYAWAGTHWTQVVRTETDASNTTIAFNYTVTPRCRGTVEYFAAMQYFAMWCAWGDYCIQGFSPTYTSYASWIAC